MEKKKSNPYKLIYYKSTMSKKQIDKNNTNYWSWEIKYNGFKPTPQILLQNKIDIMEIGENYKHLSSALVVEYTGRGSKPIYFSGNVIKESKYSYSPNYKKGIDRDDWIRDSFEPIN